MKNILKGLVHTSFILVKGLFNICVMMFWNALFYIACILSLPVFLIAAILYAVYALGDDKDRVNPFETFMNKLWRYISKLDKNYERYY